MKLHNIPGKGFQKSPDAWVGDAHAHLFSDPNQTTPRHTKSRFTKSQWRKLERAKEHNRNKLDIGEVWQE